jgi:hypothetical protein
MVTSAGSSTGWERVIVDVGSGVALAGAALGSVISSCRPLWLCAATLSARATAICAAWQLELASLSCAFSIFSWRILI